MSARSLSLRIAAAGAVYGAAVAFIFGSNSFTFGHVETVVTGAVAGALLGLYPSHARLGWLLAAALLIATAFAGSFALMPPGGDDFAPYLIVAAHSFAAAYYDERWYGVPAAIALIAAGEINVHQGGDSPGVFLFIVPGDLGGSA